MAVEEIPRRGLKVPLSEYTQLKAFQGGGCFWDVQPQQIIRHTLGEFLPEVKRESDSEGAFGLFSQMAGEKEVLSRSKPI
ncbi:MAG: hypothetical protein HW389_3538 [Bacteroidetes bacterium]|nr:hypothetical protein [Bacteroidota bacterium]